MCKAHTRHIIHMNETLRHPLLYVKECSPSLVNLVNVWICVVGGTNFIHNSNRTTFPVSCEDWKEVPNIIQGAEVGKMKDRRIV